MTHPLPRLTASDLYDLVVARLPFHRSWEGLVGEEVARAIAASSARALGRIADRLEGVLTRVATGATRASSTVRVTWAGAGASHDIEISSGQVVAQTPWGVTYRLTEPLVMAATEVSWDVAVEADWSGWEGDCDARDVSEWSLPDGVDPAAQLSWGDGVTEAAKVAFLAAISAGDLTLAGRTAPGGGALATLDLLGAERSIERAEGEPDATYRKRVRALPDVVTPAAILRAVRLALEPWPTATATLIEPWDYAWAIGDSDLGTIGDDGVCPVAALPSFLVMIAGLPYESEGWVVGDDPNGTIGEYPIGVGDTVHDGVLVGLQQLIDQIRAGGVDGRVYEEI